MPVKFRERTPRLEDHVLQLRELLAPGERLGKRLAVELLQPGFPVEGLHLRRAPGHAKKNHALGADGQVRLAQRAAPAGRKFRGAGRGRGKFVLQQRERQATEAVGALGEKRAAVDAEGVAGGVEERHGQ